MRSTFALLCAFILTIGLSGCSALSGDQELDTSARPNRFLDGLSRGIDFRPVGSTQIERSDTRTRPAGYADISSAEAPSRSGSSSNASLTPDGKKFQIN